MCKYSNSFHFSINYHYRSCQTASGWQFGTIINFFTPIHFIQCTYLCHVQNKRIQMINIHNFPIYTFNRTAIISIACAVLNAKLCCHMLQGMMVPSIIDIDGAWKITRKIFNYSADLLPTSYSAKSTRNYNCLALLHVTHHQMFRVFDYTVYSPVLTLSLS